MKKSLVKIISAILICGAFVFTAPTQDVKAYTSTMDMTYEEACAYWSATPLWKQMYDLESAKSGYLDNAKADLKTYFIVTLNDYIWKPDAVIASRPLTANFMRDMLKLTNPNIVNVVRGSVCTYQDVTEVLRAEVCNLAPSFSAGEVNSCADELRGYLHCAGVDSIGQYNDWKAITKCTAFEFYMGCCYRGHRHCSPCYDYKYYWGPWGWGWYRYAVGAAYHEYYERVIESDCHMLSSLSNAIATYEANEAAYAEHVAQEAAQVQVMHDIQAAQISQMQNLFK